MADPVDVLVDCATLAPGTVHTLALVPIDDAGGGVIVNIWNLSTQTPDIDFGYMGYRPNSGSEPDLTFGEEVIVISPAPTLVTGPPSSNVITRPTQYVFATIFFAVAATGFLRLIVTPRP
jgi:hypothetical protein